MNKFLGYSLGALCWLQAGMCFAIDKFEVLPDLPDPLAQAAQASTVSRNTDVSNVVLPAQSVGHEPNVISIVLSLIFVILLIYVTGILYAKLNNVGLKTLKKQQGEFNKLKATVVSTTPLGSNKTLHVVELDGKRMLIGASGGSIQLIKDLGSCSVEDLDENYSHIEIPNIKIPKIEIPKIEIPSIGFSKIITKAHKKTEFEKDNQEYTENSIDETIVEANPDTIIDSLFKEDSQTTSQTEEDSNMAQHMVDPDEFALYKKYMKK